MVERICADDLKKLAMVCAEYDDKNGNDDDKVENKRKQMTKEDRNPQCNPVNEQVKYGGVCYFHQCVNTPNKHKTCKLIFCNPCLVEAKQMVTDVEENVGEKHQSE